MKPAAFAYHAPASLSEALSLLAVHGEDGKVLAGGQSLVPAMNFRLARPATLIDINNVIELSGVSGDSRTGLRIGALTRHAFFHVAPDQGPLGRFLSQIVQSIAHYPIRQRGTFGGSLSHADPASEWCLLVTTLDATMVLRGQGGERRMRAGEFFRGTFMTALMPDELLVAIEFPAVPEGWRAGFYEYSRRKGDYALAMSTALLRVEDGRIAEARIGVGGVADRALRLRPVEEALLGSAPGFESFERAADLARSLVNPPGDIHGSGEYRRDLVGTAVARALEGAVR